MLRCPALCLAAVTGIVIVMTTHQVDARWPPVVPSGGMAQYECCCVDNPECGGCFRCRQNVYTCYCDTCSCYRRCTLVAMVTASDDEDGW